MPRRCQPRSCRGFKTGPSLESAGIVSRTVYPDIPVRIEYRLTEKGRELQQIVEAISGWAERWAEPLPVLQPASAP